MRTALQNFARRRLTEARAAAVADRDWHRVGWLDRKLNKLATECPFAANEAAREEWLAGWNDADAILKRGRL